MPRPVNTQSVGREPLSAWHLMAILVAIAVWLGLAGALRAAPVDELMQALQVEKTLGIMRDEGLAYGEELGDDMFNGGDSQPWQAVLQDIYDPEKMRSILRQHFEAELERTDLAPLIGFFDSERGQDIVTFELGAREAMIDNAIEQAAREAYHAADMDSARMQQITRFIEVGDLLEVNVAGALNASFMFYSGLVDGGGMAMSEGEILADVWSQEEETRADTREWMYAYLMMAYEPLSADTLEAYIEMSETPEGRALNRALFAGFNAMYDEISYALGLAAAQQLQTQEL